MKPIVTRKQVVLSILVGMAGATWIFVRERMALPKSHIEIGDVGSALTYGVWFWLIAFLSFRPRPELETEAERRGRILGQKIALGIVLLGLLGVAGVAVWTSIAPGHIR